MRHERALRGLYGFFNARDIDRLLAAMTPDVDWPNTWEGGRLVGRDAVRDYWLRQWAAFDSKVGPISITERIDRSTEVMVHQVVRDRSGEVLSDSQVRHVYTFRGDLVCRMDIP
jgi:hypothetical protein